MTPLVDPETVEIPLANVMAVVEPNAIAVPEELLTVGLFEPCAWAPQKVRLFEPV